MFHRISQHLYRFEDTCHVYVLRSGTDAVLIDFGSGDVLHALETIGVRRVTDVLMTHHHRDQAQGLPLAVEAGARIWVPHAEFELFAQAERRWNARDAWNNYNTREDRFSIVSSVPIAGTFREYVPTTFGGVEITPIPLPGHTVGSVGFLASVDGFDVGFTGDLLAGEGKMWSLAATQWSYAGPEGLAMTWLSLQDLRERDLDLLLPSHGTPMDDPRAAIDLTSERVRALLDLRKDHLELADRRDEPYQQVTEHLLYNRASHCRSYVLLADSGKALFLDFGYDFEAGWPAGTDRASRHPWLYTLPALKQRYGVTSIDVVIPTHYHDDHVAGFNLLRDVEGTEVWAGENLVDVLERPEHYDLPCLWYDPIPVDRSLPLGQPVSWEEHELVLHPLPGHTLYAVAIELEIDGVRALCTGDQTDGDHRLNYVYQNRFRAADYRVTGELYERLAPDVLLTGHWGPMWVDPDTLATLKERGAELERLHRQLLPDSPDLDAEGRVAWIRPYQHRVAAGDRITYEVEVRNTCLEEADVEVELATPTGWSVQPPRGRQRLMALAHGSIVFEVEVPPGTTAHRKIVTADVWVAGRRLGQVAEAMVEVS